MKTCKTFLGQHLLCRDRLPKDKKSNFIVYEECKFLNYTAYLVIDLKHQNNSEEAVGDPQARLESSVDYAISKGYSKEVILQICTEAMTKHGE